MNFCEKIYFRILQMSLCKTHICLVTDPGSKMDSSLLAVRDINHKYIVAEADIK